MRRILLAAVVFSAIVCIASVLALSRRRPQATISPGEQAIASVSPEQRKHLAEGRARWTSIISALENGSPGLSPKQHIGSFVVAYGQYVEGDRTSFVLVATATVRCKITMTPPAKLDFLADTFTVEAEGTISEIDTASRLIHVDATAARVSATR